METMWNFDAQGVRCVRWQDLFAARRFLGVSWRVSRANTRGQGKVGGKMGSWDGIEVPGSIAGAAVLRSFCMSPRRSFWAHYNNKWMANLLLSGGNPPEDTYTSTNRKYKYSF